MLVPLIVAVWLFIKALGNRFNALIALAAAFIGLVAAALVRPLLYNAAVELVTELTETVDKQTHALLRVGAAIVTVFVVVYLGQHVFDHVRRQMRTRVAQRERSDGSLSTPPSGVGSRGP